MSIHGSDAGVVVMETSHGGNVVTARARWATWLVLGGYPLAWLSLFHVSDVHWFLPAGLRLACLWWLAPRRWPWLFLVEVTFLVGFTLWRESGCTPVSLAIDACAPFIAYALAIALVRWWRQRHATAQDGELIALLQAGAVAACFNALALGLLRPQFVDLPGAAGGNPLHIALGDYLGQLLVAPLLWAIATAPNRRPRLVDTVTALAIGATPALLVGLLVVFAPQSHSALLELGAAVIVLFAIAYQADWATTAYSNTALSATLVMLAGTGQGAASVIASQPVELQAVVAAIGTGALALAVVAQAQRAAAQHWRELAALESQQREVLQEAAVRIISAQERERLRIGRDLHDTLGQTMTATKLRLRALSQSDSAELTADLAEIENLVATSQAELYGVIRALNPVDVDHYGLADALRLGSIASMLSAADIRLDCQIELAEPLGARTEVDLFRICQEAAQNVAKHSTATRFSIRLLSTAENSGKRVLLELGDDAGPIVVRSAGRHGLQSIRDRATALNADYHFETSHGAPRHRLTLFQPGTPTPATRASDGLPVRRGA